MSIRALTINQWSETVTENLPTDGTFIGRDLAKHIRNFKVNQTEQLAAGSERLLISAANVAEVDGAGLQLLAALSNMDQSWQLVEPSKVFADACRLLGLNQWLDQRVADSHKTGAQA